MKKKWINTDNLFNLLIVLGSLLLFLFLWEYAVNLFSIQKFILPKPSRIFMRAYELRQLIWQHTQVTLFEALAGLGLSLILSVMLAIVLDISKVLNKLFYPWMIISQTIPLTAVAPLFIIWFGFGSISKLLVVMLVCFFPLVINILTGFREVDEDLLDLMKIMQANTFQIYTKVKLPNAIPYILSGLKISTTYAILAAVIGEWMGGVSGLGIFMSRMLKTFDTTGLFAIIFVVMFLSVFLILIVQFVEYKLIKWK